MAFASGLMVVGFVMLAYPVNNMAIFLFLAFFSIGFGSINPLRGSFLRKYFGMRYFGKLLGIAMGISSVGGIIGPTLTGFIYDLSGTYQLVWLGFAVSLVVAVILIMNMSQNYSDGS